MFPKDKDFEESLATYFEGEDDRSARRLSSGSIKHPKGTDGVKKRLAAIQRLLLTPRHSDKRVPT